MRRRHFRAARHNPHVGSRQVVLSPPRQPNNNTIRCNSVLAIQPALGATRRCERLRSRDVLSRSYNNEPLSTDSVTQCSRVEFEADAETWQIQEDGRSTIKTLFVE